MKSVEQSRKIVAKSSGELPKLLISQLLSALL